MGSPPTAHSHFRFEVSLPGFTMTDVELKKASFAGRSVYVWGSLRPRNVSTVTGVVRDPDWDCFLDGNYTGKHWDYPTTAYSNYALCSGGDITDGDHTLELKATVRGETLWVDQVQYRASIDTDVSTAWTEVRHGDGRFKYSGDWRERRDGYGMATTTNGAWFTYEFNGTSFRLQALSQSASNNSRILAGEGVVIGGYTPGNATLLDGLATYSLDGGPPTVFTIPSTVRTKMNQPYFNITSLGPGPHRLEVVNKGNDSTTPLAFSYIYTKNAPSPTAPAIKPKHTSKIIGGAVGGGLGVIILTALLIFLILRNCRCQRRPHLILPPTVPAPEESATTPDAVYPQVRPTLRRSSQRDFHTESPLGRHHTATTLLSQSPSMHASVSRSQSPPPAYSDVPSHPSSLVFSADRYPTVMATTSSQQAQVPSSSQGRPVGSAAHNTTPYDSGNAGGIQYAGDGKTG